MQIPIADPLLHGEPQYPLLPFVGRELEMSLVALLLATVVDDRSEGARALILSGESGVGKSRLLAEIYKEGRGRGMLVLETPTYEMGAIFPYLPFVEVLRPLLRTLSLAQLRRYTGLVATATAQVEGDISLTGSPLVAALQRLFPELAVRLGIALPPQELLTPDQEKFRLFDSIATLLEQIALEQPVLLSIDNLQWADSASLELTMYLTVRLHRSRVALVGATRPTAFSADQQEAEGSSVAALKAMKLLGELMRQRLLLFLPLGPLSEAAAQQHLHALLPGGLPDDIAHSLLYRAEGNPYFLEELVRTLVLRESLVLRNTVWQARRPLTSGTLPQSISQAVAEQLQGLRGRALLQVAALFGRTFPQAPLAQVAETTSEQVQLLLAEALEQKIIARVEQEDALQSAGEQEMAVTSSLAVVFVFCRGIVHEVLRSEVSPLQAVSLHGSIGRALEAYFDADAVAHAAELARHAMLGDLKERALYWSVLAGEEATRQQAHREAIGQLRAVLRLLEAGVSTVGLLRPVTFASVSLALGESWLKLGELSLAADALRQAIERQGSGVEAASEQFPFVLVRANRLLGDIYRVQGKYELALAHLQAASNLCEQDESDELAHSGRLVRTELTGGPIATSAAQVYAVPTVLYSTELLLLLQARATLDILLYQPEKAEDELWRAYRLATTLGERSGQAFALHFLGWLRGWGEQITEAMRLIKQAHDLYMLTGDPFHAVLGAQSLGIIHQARGEMEQARQYNLHGFELARRYGVQQVIGWLHCNQAVMAIAQGDWEESELHLQNALQDGEEQNNLRLTAFATQVQAMLAVRRGDWEQAASSFQRALQAAVNTEWYPSTLALYGHFLAVTGREREALVQLERVEKEREPFGYSGHFYIPFLAEAHLHLQKSQRAALYRERIGNLHGFCYYGVAVDRILGEIAAQSGEWEEAERAFDEGLALCRRAHNRPEEAFILYEQARTVLMRSRADISGRSKPVLERVQDLCQRARRLFVEYRMQRAVEMVDTLQAGVEQLEGESKGARTIAPVHLAQVGYQLELRLTRRELDVLRLVAEGQTDREVAEALVLSPRTVNRHLSNIFTKLDVPGRAAAVAYAIRQGLVK